VWQPTAGGSIIRAGDYVRTQDIVVAAGAESLRRVPIFSNVALHQKTCQSESTRSKPAASIIDFKECRHVTTEAL
jgi:hypothetical protein